jgi:hypothetical protein
MSKTTVREFVPPIIGLFATFFYHEVVNPAKLRQPIFVLNPGPRTFWITSNLSSIVILNLIANLRFLYHKPKNTRILH